MTEVTLAFPNGQRQDVLLLGVPREGESIRLANGSDDPSLEVLHVVWLEGRGRTPDPTVLVKVRPRPGVDSSI